MLTLDKLNKSFINNSVIKDFSYRFSSNGIYKIEGPNGVGKTTLLKMIKGILVQDRGIITLDCGTTPNECSTYIDANNRSFFHRLTVKENLNYFMALNKQPTNSWIFQSLVEEFQIAHLLNQVFSVLSVGQMQVVSLIRGFLEQPKVLLIDEAFTNIDQQRLAKIAGYLEAFADGNDKLIIICSHTNFPVKIIGTVYLE